MKFYLKYTHDFRPLRLSFYFSSSPSRLGFIPNVSSLGQSRTLSKLHAAGININLFSAHSTRHASTSLAICRGINVDEIEHAAGWSRSSDVFARFYNRPIIGDTSLHLVILNMP